MMDAAFAALLAGRTGQRWRRDPELARLDDRMRRDIGLPPRDPPALPLRRHGI
ncbi:hypothetical protein ACVFYP_22075 [Roseomonas sp. F4]